MTNLFGNLLFVYWDLLVKEMPEDKISIQFPDGNKKTYPKGIRPKDIIEEIGSHALKQKAVVAQVNGKLVDLNRPI